MTGVFNANGSVNHVKRYELSEHEKKNVVTNCNASLFFFYTAFREILKLTKMKNPFSVDELNFFKDVQSYMKHITDSHYTLEYAFLDIIDNYCENKESRKAVSDILSFGYDAAFLPISAMKGTLYKKILPTCSRRKNSSDMAGYIMQTVITRNICYMAVKTCEKTVSKYKSFYPHIADILHLTDICNGFTIIDMAYKYAIREVNNNIFADQDFVIAQSKLIQLFNDENFFPKICKCLKELDEM